VGLFWKALGGSPQLGWLWQGEHVGISPQRTLPSAAGGTGGPHCHFPANGHETLMVKPYLLEDISQALSFFLQFQRHNIQIQT